MNKILLFATVLVALPAWSHHNWDHTRKQVFERDAGKPTLYCGCDWDLESKTADFDSCGYEVRKSMYQALQLHGEHKMTAKRIAEGMGLTLPGGCWERGAREACAEEHEVYRRAVYDPVNVSVAIGEVNVLRLDRPYGIVHGEPREFGACDFEVDGVAEPRPEIRMHLIEVYEYMSRTYGIPLTLYERVLFKYWLEAENPYKTD